MKNLLFETSGVFLQNHVVHQDFVLAQTPNCVTLMSNFFFFIIQLQFQIFLIYKSLRLKGRTWISIPPL